MIKGMTLSGTSVEVGVIGDEDGHALMRVVLFSSSVRMTSISFKYRLDFLGAWLSDAVLRLPDNGFCQGNQLLQLPCSPEGSETTFTWDHAANGLASGMRCQVRVKVLPSVAIMSQSNKVTTIEGVSEGDARVIEEGMEGRAMCFDDEGGVVVAYDHSVVRMPPGGGRGVVLVSGIARPKCVTATGRYSCLILDGDGVLREVDNDGLDIALASVAGLASGEPGLSCDPATGNILLAGCDVPKVYELAWQPSGYGEILWEYGQPTSGSGSGYLDSPQYASYGQGGDVVLICDTGNDRVVVVDRGSVPQAETDIYSVTIGTVTLSLSKPMRCSWADDAVLVCEASGERESFSVNAGSHPAMARSGMSAASGKDSLSQYSGLRFVPLPRSVKSITAGG
jgi:hypothetical protein